MEPIARFLPPRTPQINDGSVCTKLVEDRRDGVTPELPWSETTSLVLKKNLVLINPLPRYGPMIFTESIGQWSSLKAWLNDVHRKHALLHDKWDNLSTEFISCWTDQLKCQWSWDLVNESVVHQIPCRVQAARENSAPRAKFLKLGCITLDGSRHLFLYGK